MSRTWSVELPFSRPLSMNDRMHHMVKAKVVAEWRSQTAAALRAEQIPAMSKVKATLFYIPKVNRRRDPDNLVASFKPAIDALVDAGIVPDDTQEFVERVWPVILTPDTKRENRFVLQVDEIE
jgi:crossover junction endodeoxyribonuclease RusA